MQKKITPCLWFDTEAEEAARFYCSVFKNSQIVEISHYTDAGPRPAGAVMMVTFELDGQQLTALNAGPGRPFTQAVSLQVPCDTQAEIDHYWTALTRNGGEESVCGWLKDQFGLSWQIFPKRLVELELDPDRARAQRAMAAMMTMKKIDIAAIERAAKG
jgi:predicted 3-demethylubiquinone-9 3-methyltransferase (glyoxalase superfamily)